MREMFFGASPEIFRRARDLRDNPTPAEKVLWKCLSRGQLGVKFRRQHPISDFIADFYCHHAKLVIELDGSIHDEEEQSDYDKGRTYELEALGLTVIRFQNEEVMSDLDVVLNQIKLLI